MPSTTNSLHPDLEIRGFPFGHYLANPDSNHPFIVSAIPKCGCSTVKRWLCRTMNDDPSAISGGAIHKHCRDNYALIKLHPERARKLLESSFTFTILRDPALRLASAYVAKFVARGALDFSSKPVVERVQAGESIEYDAEGETAHAESSSTLPISTSVDYDRGISFREFVSYLEQTADEELNHHWRPQANFLATPMAFTGTAEQLAWSLAQISQRLSLDTPIPEDRPQRAQQPATGPCLADLPAGELRAKELTPGAADLFDDDLRARVQARYAKDFELHAEAARP